ncbi:MAG: response regulator transcription factor [Cyanophyceae cyanobacterium]|nr:response regulator [Synechococcaceae cyanobacterium SM2_3_2]
MSTILVVEDNRTYQEMISELLKENGMDVVTASDGIEAMEKVKTVIPDLVVLDVVMPRMNGYEVCRELKGDPRTQSVLIVMCSTKDQEFDRHWANKQGADAYVTKPFRPQELVATIKQLLRR